MTLPVSSYQQNNGLAASIPRAKKDAEGWGNGGGGGVRGGASLSK